MSNHKFKIGQRVAYKLLNKVLFTGTITGLNKTKGIKPYTVLCDHGIQYYSTADFLTAI